MASSSPQAHLENLQDQINTATAQLQSLDRSDENYDVKKMVLKHGLESLAEQYEAAEREDHSFSHTAGAGILEEDDDSSSPMSSDQRPQSSDTVIRYSDDDSASRTEGNTNSFGDHFAPGNASEAHDEAPAWSFNNTRDTTAPPDSPSLPSTGGYSASASVSSHDSRFPRPQKRQRESLGSSSNSASHPHKSMRSMPSPTTATTTPTSMSSFELPEDPDLLALLGGDPAQDLRDMREEQKEQERVLDARRQQELADEDFARQLMEQENGFTPFESSSPPGSSMTRGNTSQTVLDRQGAYRRPTPYPLSSPIATKAEDPFSTSSLPVKQESSYRSNFTPIESEGPSRWKQNYVPPSDFIDLEEDDFFNQQLDILEGTHPSSDLVEIDASAFGANQQNGQAQSSSAGIPNSYGNSAAPGASSWGYTGGQFGQSIANAASTLYNGAYNLLDQHVGSSASASGGFGGMSVYRSNNQGLSADIIDLESYDQTPYSPQDVFSRHGINVQDPANRDLVATFRDRVDYVANDPTRTSAEIKCLLENIRPDEDLPPENREGTPEAMMFRLMEHQKLGLAWMKSMEGGSNKGGILADDMGLGKTIQALALIVSSQSTDRLCKTTLIVCPVALLKQWDSEIRTKLKRDHQLKVYTLHSERRHVDWAKLRTYDVVLTTFGTLGTETKRKEQIAMSKRANPNWRPSGKNDYLPLLGDECQWYRVIIDEAQCIKNKNTKAAVGAAMLQAKTRFCMTGTPMMNNVTELFSLIHFLRIKPYCEADRFSKDFTRPLKGNSESAKTKAMRQLQALLKAILLRRTKKSQIDGKPILDLPERTTEPCHAAFSEDEATFYSALESRTQLQFNKFLKAGTVGRNYSNILVLLLRLRQACCHPHLIKDFGQASAATDIDPEEMKKLAKELAPDVVARIKDQSRLNDDAALECPVCMDLAENATIFIPCGHNTCSECFARISDPSQAIADGNAEGRGEAKCPNCRGKITQQKVIDHKVFKQIYMPELLSPDDTLDDPEADAETTDDSEDSSEDDEDDDTEELDSKGNIKGFIVEEDEVDDEASETEDDGEDGYRAGQTPFEKAATKKNKKSKKGKGKATETKAPKKTLAQLKKEGMRNIKARKRYLKRLNKDWIPSAKTEKVIELLREIQARKDPVTKQCEKTIIFSQFTSLLDLLEVPIAAENWNYSRYDGSMSATARNDAVADFMGKRDCKVMLVSLKAGNAGLNLVAGSQVIILDPFWNPFVEEQAIDRAHRIGQQKHVRVHRILIPNTVEDRILALQEKKRELIEGALDENASRNIGRLGTRELGFLFDVPT